MTTLELPSPDNSHQNDNFSAQVRISLYTREKNYVLKDENRMILVPRNFKRFQLSTIINTLLATAKPVPFEFIINGIFLRTSLDSFIKANGIPTESHVCVEYVQALIPPSDHHNAYIHDDWVSSIDVIASRLAIPFSQNAGNDVKSSKIICSGSFDGIVRVWNACSQLIATSGISNKYGHDLAVKTVKFTSPNSLASGSMDRSICLWNMVQADHDPTKISLNMHTKLLGHSDGIDCIDFSSSSNRLLSASCDNKIGYWTTEEHSMPPVSQHNRPDESGQPAQKSQKLSISNSQFTYGGPLAMLDGHNARVSGVMFSPLSPMVAYSVSHDSTFRTWDLNVARSGSSCVSVRTLTCPLFCLCFMPGGNVVASGTSEGYTVLIDPRESATKVVNKFLRGHVNFVSAVTVCPTSDYGLASASHDGCVKLWDIRGGTVSKSESTYMIGGGGVNLTSSNGPTVGCVSTINYKMNQDMLNGIGDSKHYTAPNVAPQKRGNRTCKLFDVHWDDQLGIISCGEDKMIHISGFS